MWDKCLDCDQLFDTHLKMKNHFNENHLKNYKCRLCPKMYDNLEDALHHLLLEHKGMTKEHLRIGVAAEQTKRQLGDYIINSGVGVNYDCPECFEMFPSIDKLDVHRKKIHNMMLTSGAREKLKELYDTEENKAPQCEICKKRYLGLIVCKMDNKPIGACMNCYEDYYGPNALTRLTIGTPSEMILRMKTPIV